MASDKEARKALDKLSEIHERARTQGGDHRDFNKAVAEYVGTFRQNRRAIVEHIGVDAAKARREV